MNHSDEIKKLANHAAEHYAKLDQSRKQIRELETAFYDAERKLADAITTQVNQQIGPNFVARVTLYKNN